MDLTQTMKENPDNKSESSMLNEKIENQYAEGRWTMEEHKQFLLGVMQYGKDWKQIDQLISTRTSTQIRSHAQKYFQKLVKQQKDQKKNKNKLKTGLTELEKELVTYFTTEDIGKQTPIEFVTIIKKGMGMEEHLDPEEHKESNWQNSRPAKGRRPVDQEKKVEMMEEIEDGEEQSYLIRTLKNNPVCLKEGHQFYELIDFGRESLMKPEENETCIRKRSFGLPEDMHNQERLKETLHSFHHGSCQQEP